MKSNLKKISVRLPENIVAKVDEISQKQVETPSDVYRSICEFGLKNFELIDLNLDEKMMRKIKSYSKKLDREPAYVVQKALEKFFKIEIPDPVIEEKIEEKNELIEEKVSEIHSNIEVDLNEEWGKFGF